MQAFDLAAQGVSVAAMSRRLLVSRSVLAAWLAQDLDGLVAQREREHVLGECSVHEDVAARSYAYLLGLYLGDGCISRSRGVFRLRIACCDAYPGLLRLCEEAIAAVLPNGNTVGRTQSIGCTEVYAYWKHWPCLFPQHGLGRKHERSIELAPWQLAMVKQYPRELLRGLIHSDGCRIINRVRSRDRVYEYPRYFFTNVSKDIQGIFCDACDAIGVEWRLNRWNSVSVAKRASVALLDEFIGPKF